MKYKSRWAKMIEDVNSALAVSAKRLEALVATLVTLRMTPEHKERASILVYNRAVKQQRDIGRTTIKAHADRVFTETGLIERCDIMDNGTWCATHEVGPRIFGGWRGTWAPFASDWCHIALGYPAE